MTTPDEEEQHIVHEMCDLGSHNFARAMQRKLERFYERFRPIRITIVGSTACLEFPVHYLAALNRNNSATIHSTKWDEISKTLGDSKPEYDRRLDEYESMLQKPARPSCIDTGKGDPLMKRSAGNCA